MLFVDLFASSSAVDEGTLNVKNLLVLETNRRHPFLNVKRLELGWGLKTRRLILTINLLMPPRSDNIIITVGRLIASYN